MKKVFGLLSLMALVLTGCNQTSTVTAELSDADSPLESQAVLATPAPTIVAEIGSPERPAAKFVQTTANSATLKAKFVLKGDPPPVEKIDGSRDPFCAELEIVSEKLVIGEGGGIQNLAIYLDARRTDAKIPEIPVEDKSFQLDNKNCAFVPHVLTARPGQKIRVTNSDKTGHNANFSFFNNEAINFLLPAGGEKEFELKADEPAPIPVACNIHPWMEAYVIVMEHPFVGVTNSKGELTIENLPVGEVAFRVWHESGTIDEVTINGEEESWRRGRMEMELKPGVNDLGTVVVDAELFE